MLEDYKEGLKSWGETFKVAPIRTIAGWLFMIPSLCIGFYLLLIFVGALLDMVLTFIFYGLSGLSNNRWGETYYFFLQLAKFFLKVFSFMIPFGGIVLKMFINCIYIFIGGILLSSAMKEEDKRKGGNGVKTLHIT